MNYSIRDTVIVYQLEAKIMKLVSEFSIYNMLKIYKADRESDLIAVPNLFILTDINKLTNETFAYINESVREGILKDELIISYTEPKSEISLLYSKYFEIKTDVSVQDLNDILLERIGVKDSFQSNL